MPRANKKTEALTDTWGRRNRKLEDHCCPSCGVMFRPLRSTSRYCSRPCLWVNNGGQNKKPESWWINAAGYIQGRIWDGNVRKDVKQHRVIMERHLGRALLPDEDVHHINGIKSDNRIENLEVLTHSEHSTLTNNERHGRANGGTEHVD